MSYNCVLFVGDLSVLDALAVTGSNYNALIEDRVTAQCVLYLAFIMCVVNKEFNV